MGDISEGLPESGGSPPYIQEGSDWADAWTDEFEGWSLFTDVGLLAYNGDVYTLQIIADREPELITERPCATAVAAVTQHQLSVVQFLIEEMEFDVNMVCGKFDPGTLLDYAVEDQDDEDDAIVKYLLANGALGIEEVEFDADLLEEIDYDEDDHDEL